MTNLPDVAGARERLEKCADDLRANALYLKDDSPPSDPNSELHHRIADERLQWSADLRTLLSRVDELEGALREIGDLLTDSRNVGIIRLKIHAALPHPDTSR